MYVRDSLKHHRRRDIPEAGLEFVGIEVEPNRARPFLVAAWYRLPSDPIESFTKLEGNLEFFDRENKEIIFLGDTNCDMFLLENSPENTTNNVYAAVHMASIYDTFGLTQLIKDPTRETWDTATLIDHVASIHPQNIPESGVLKVALSDHYAVYCIRKYMGTFKRQQKIITTRKMKNFDQNSFLFDLSQVDWNQIVESSTNVNEAVGKWSAL